MKLSLPLVLRTALLAALTVVCPTLGSAVAAGGLITLALVPQAIAASPIILTEDTLFDELNAPDGLQADGYTVTLTGDSDIASTTAGTSLTVTGGRTDLRGGALNNLSLSDTGSVTIHKYMEAASYSNSGSGTLNVVTAFKAGGTLYVGNHMHYSDLTIDSLINNGTLIVGYGTASNKTKYDLTINNGTTQGGYVVAKNLTVGGDSTFSNLYLDSSLTTNGNTVTLTGDSSIGWGINTSSGAEHNTSLVIAGGHTTLGGYGTLNALCIENGASLTLTANVTTETLSIAENGSLTINENQILQVNTQTEGDVSKVAIHGALNDCGTLYVGNHMHYSDLTIDTLINNGTLIVGYGTASNKVKYDLTINNGTTQGGYVVAENLTVGRDSTFSNLYLDYSLTTNGNTVTLTGDSSIGWGINTSSGAEHSTSLVIAGGHTTLDGYGTLNALCIEDGASLTIVGYRYIEAESLSLGDTAVLNVEGALNVNGTLYAGNYNFSGGQKVIIDTLIGTGTLGVNYLTINHGTTQGGNLKNIITLNVGGDSVFNSLKNATSIHTKGNTITLTGDSDIHQFYTSSDATQDTSLAIAGGHTTVSYGDLHNLSVSSQGRLTYGSALNVAGNISTSEAVGTLAEGLTSGVEASGNISVGTVTDGVLAEGTGQVDLAGSLSSTGGSITIGGSATLGGGMAAKGDISMGGAASVTGGISSTEGSITLTGGGSVGGLVSASNVTVGANATFGQLNTAGTLTANGHTVTLSGNSSMQNLDTGTVDHTAGSSSLIITGGTTSVTVGNEWTNLSSLALSREARATFGASVSVANDISVHGTATGTLPEGTKAGLETKYCVYAGGSITLAGELKAGAYVEAGGDIAIAGATTVGDYLKSTNGGITLTGGGSVSGKVTAKSLSVGANSTFNQLSIYGGGAYDGALNANGNTVTLTGNATVHAIDASLKSEDAVGTSSLIISGGTTEVRTTGQWTSLKSLALSDEARMSLGASLNVSGNVTTHATAVGTLATDKKAGLESGWCIKVGTLEDGKLKANTGDVTLSGDLVARQGYMHIMGNANVSQADGELGNLTSGQWLTIGGTATVAGNVTASGDIKIGGAANIAGALSSTSGDITLSSGGTFNTVSAAGTVSIGGASSINSVAQVSGATQAPSLVIAGGSTIVKTASTLQSLSIAEGAALTVEGGLHLKGELNADATNTAAADGQLTVSGALQLEASAAHVAISAQSASIASADGSELTLDAVDLALVTGSVDLGQVRLTGDSAIRATGDSQGLLTFERLTLVLGEHSSMLTPQMATLALEDEAVVEGLAQAATFGIQSDMLQNVSLAEGGEMLIDLSYWEEEIARSGLENVTLSFGEDVDLSAMPGVKVTFDGENFAEASMVDGNVASFEVGALVVPEPGTATLSLLALAALAARRRRR